jgi:hypothetical protein
MDRLPIKIPALTLGSPTEALMGKDAERGKKEASVVFQ